MVLAHLSRGRYPVRDRTLLRLGIRSGFRISELLCLRVKDVFQNGKVVSRLHISRRFMKGKKESREVPLHPDAREALAELVATLPPDPEAFLFQSREGDNKPLNRRSAWAMLKKAFAACGLEGKLATHTMRKTFAKRVYEKSGKNLRETQEALRHKNINSTAAYVPVDETVVDDLILKS